MEMGQGGPGNSPAPSGTGCSLPVRGGGVDCSLRTVHMSRRGVDCSLRTVHMSRRGVDCSLRTVQYEQGRG